MDEPREYPTVKDGVKQVVFDVTIIAVAVGLIIGWAFDLPVVYVPTAALLGLALVYWNHPKTRRLRGVGPQGEKKNRTGLSKTPDAIK